MPNTTRPRRPATACACRFAVTAPLHHDLLVRVDTDVSVAVELLELATTWDELDYGDQSLVAPADWLAFLAGHRWTDPDLAERLFIVAVDVALRHGAPVPVPHSVLAPSGS